MAFLDVNPRAIGHTLVIPKKEVDYLFDIDDDTLGPLMVFAKGVARAIRKVVPCQRIGVAVIGLEVPHTHIHLVPINQVGDINFERAPISCSPEELADLASRISESYHHG
jgi:histidine triad (HIT) family protein